MDFRRDCIDKLENFYEVEKLERPDITVKIQYRVKNDTFGFKFYDENVPELVTSIDNFPGQRQYRHSNLPIKTFEDLEYNLKQAGIELVRNPKVLVFYVKEGLTEEDEADEIFSIAECKSLGYTFYLSSPTGNDFEERIRENLKHGHSQKLRAESIVVVFGAGDKRNFTFELNT